MSGAMLPFVNGQAYGPELYGVVELESAGEPGRRERPGAGEWEWGEDPDLWLYREMTIGLLKRYMRMAMEVGRLPTLLGREFFRAKVSSRHVVTFEDAVIFVHDVEQCLGKLDRFGQKLIARIVLEEYSKPETARLLGCGLRSVERCLPEALDRLSQMFLRGSLMRPMAKTGRGKSCQGGRTEEKCASCCCENE